MGQQLGGTDQRLGRDAAGVQAVAAHLMLLDQGHLGLDRRGDVGGDQSGAAGADDDQVAIEAGGFGPVGVDAPRLDRRDDSLGDQRKHPEQNEGSQ